MPTDRSELSSLGTLLGQLTGRVAAIAQSAHEDRDDKSATELFAIERALIGAQRRIERLLTAPR